jgi:excisionase family DNA binding protein
MTIRTAVGPGYRHNDADPVDRTSETFVVDDQLLVTPEEAGRRLSVGRTTIYELMSRGELQSVNIGRGRRVAVSSLSSFVSKLLSTADERPDVAGRRAVRHSLGVRSPHASHAAKREAGPC